MSGNNDAIEFADLARSRLPQWRDRIFVGNAINWMATRPGPSEAGRVAALDFLIAGASEWPHLTSPRFVYRAFWVDHLL